MRSWVYFMLTIVILVDSTFCAPGYGALEGAKFPEKRSIEKRKRQTTVDPITALLGSAGNAGSSLVKSGSDTVQGVYDGLAQNLGKYLS